jgi:hypothetical protein
MDPVTTIGLVSGILSFVDAAEKILKLSWELYNSVEGSPEETEMRLKLADSTAVIWKRLSPPNQSVVTEEDKLLLLWLTSAIGYQTTSERSCKALSLNGANPRLRAALRP